MNDDRVTEVVTAIRTEFPDVAITLSLGERPTLSYERFFKQVPIAICCATKRTTKHITAACTLKACRCPTVCVV